MGGDRAFPARGSGLKLCDPRTMKIPPHLPFVKGVGGFDGHFLTNLSEDLSVRLGFGTGENRQIYAVRSPGLFISLSILAGAFAGRRRFLPGHLRSSR